MASTILSHLHEPEMPESQEYDHEPEILFPRSLVQRSARFNTIKVEVISEIDNDYHPININPIFCAVSKAVTRAHELQGGNTIALILPTEQQSPWFRAAFICFWSWTQTGIVHTACYGQRVFYAALWEVGRRLQAPIFQNAVMLDLAEHESTVEEEVDPANIDWLYNKYKNLEALDDHGFLWFCFSLIVFKDRQTLWGEIMLRGGHLALRVAELTVAKYTEENSEWNCYPLDAVTFKVFLQDQEEDEDVEVEVEKMDEDREQMTDADDVKTQMEEMDMITWEDEGHNKSQVAKGKIARRNRTMDDPLEIEFRFLNVDD